MKIELKNNVEKLIENYKKITNAFLAEIKEWEKNSLYSSDHTKNKIREIEANMKKNDDSFNNQLKTIIMEEKNTILNATIRKPDDFQLQVSNAIGFISLSGDNLSDEEAFELMKPFFGDYQTMKRFYLALSNRGANKGVTLTCLGLFDRAVNNLDKFSNNFTYFFNVGTYIAASSLQFVLNRKAIIVDAEAIENIVQKLDKIILASYKEAKAEVLSNH